jgi:hypothetical protein
MTDSTQQPNLDDKTLFGEESVAEFVAWLPATATLRN